MKRMALVVLVVLVVHLVSLQYVVGVSIVNPGFEAVNAQGHPDGWRLFAREPGGATIQVDETTRAEGKRSLKVISTSKQDWAVSQEARVKAGRGEAFTLRAWLKAENLSWACVHVIQFTPKGERVEWFLAQLRTTDTHDWKEFKVSFLMPADGLLNVRLMGAGEGTVWFDGLSLTPRVAAAANEFIAEFEGYKNTGKIPLLLHERAGVMRFSQPITFGMCFPKGFTDPEDNFQVLDEDGRPFMRQWLIKAYWEDGSVKWATVDFQTDIMPRSTRRLMVDLTGKHHPHYDPPSTKCMEDVERVAIGSGAIMAVLSKKNFRLFDLVAYDAEAEDRFPGSPRVLNGGPDTGFEMVLNGKKFTTGEAKFTFEESAYLKAILKAEGQHRGPLGEKGFDYTVRIYTYAARPILRMTYTFTNKLDAAWSHVGAVTLHLRPAFKVKRVCVGGEFGTSGLHATELASGELLTLRQIDEKRCTVTHTKAQGEPMVREGGKAAGWVTVAGEGLGLTFGVTDFWQNFPTGFVITAENIAIELISPQKEPFAVERGAAKTYEISIMAHKEENFPRALEMGPALIYPVWAALPPAWYVGCKIFGEALPSDVKHFPFVEHLIDQKYESAMHTARLPGWINWGDYRWQNTEVDMHHGLFVQFMRTGDPKYLEWAIPMARHSSDLDIKHYDTAPEKIGGGIRHRDYFDKKEAVGTYNHTSGGVCASHTWLRGYLDAFFLTGEWRYMDVAREVGDFLVRNATDPKAPGGGGGRESGRMLEQLTALYAATHDKKYLTAMKKVVDFLLEIQQGDGSWFSFGRNVKNRRRNWSAYDRGGHCSSVILSGLKSYHEVTGEDRVVQSFIDGVDYMMWEAMTPEQNSFLYGTTMGDLRERTKYAITRRREDPFTSTHMLENLAYAYRLTLNLDYLEIGQKVLKYMMEKGQITPHLFTPYGTQFLSVMREEGLSLTEIPESVLWVTCVPERLDFKRGEKARFTLRLLNRTDKDILAKVSLTLPWGLIAAKSEETIALNRNIQKESAFDIIAKPDAPLGAGEIKATITAMDGTTERKVSTLIVERRVGYIGEPEYHTDVALRKMGVRVIPITDVGREDLSRFEVIFVGVEAHNKDSAGIRTNSHRLNDYIRGGGRTLIFQLNDENWRPEFLPYPLYVSEEDHNAAKIIAPDSPIFKIKHKITDITGLKQYDSLRNLAPEWKVLASAEDGSPSIVETHYGKGYVIVCQPSVDRYYAGTEQKDTLTTEQRTRQYCDLFENIVEHVLKNIP